MKKLVVSLFFRSIGAKLALFVLLLIAVITAASAFLVTDILDRFLVAEMVKRGQSIALSATTPAGFSILSGDRLALDNLAAKIKESQQDILYLAIVDTEGKILAHNDLSKAGQTYAPVSGTLLEQSPSGTVRRVVRDEVAGYEFSSGVHFAGRHVGQVFLGIDAANLEASRGSARRQIAWVSVAALLGGVVGAILLSRLVTGPIQRLATGVNRIKQGDYRVTLVPRSRDELGELTRRFNEMAGVIQGQKERLQKYAENLESSYSDTVRILAAAIDARDQYTYGHSSRVAGLSLLLGEKMGLSSEELKELEMACFLHDVGKIRIPDEVLNKQGALDEQEAKLIRCHPSYGAEILGLADSLHRYIPAVLQHHEFYDGSGYPAGLKGSQIHLHAQIVALADSFDAMISSRPYRSGRSRDAAVREILKCRGTQFSPELTDLFIKILPEFDAGRRPSFMGDGL